MTDIYNDVKNLSADKIREYLQTKTESGYCDKASLFIAFSYISEPPEGDKDSFRKKAYLTYINEDKQTFKKAWDCIGCLEGVKDAVDMKIRILKGGSYKIKDYYLENNDLNDIRGASILLTHIEQNVVPNEIIREFIPECIVYNGGGNIFAILPENADADFAKKLEEMADKLLITASVAYCMSEPINVTDILSDNYRSKMAAIENKLDERKKLKIYNTIKNNDSAIPDSFDIPFGGKEKLSVKFGDVRQCRSERERKEFCSACGKRFAEFTLNDAPLCKGCLTKRKVGKAAESGIYIKEFIEETKRIRDFEPKRIYTAEDISDDKIAVIYADGNNMGGIIQHFSKITQMMEFSRSVKEITRREVYNALCENKVKAFEIVALGGDDVFVIVTAEKSFDFAVSFAKKYKDYFTEYLNGNENEDISTMSVGIAAAKNNTPVKILLEAAENMLDEAKKFEREQEPRNRDGSIAFTILDSYNGSDDNSDSDDDIAKRTMQPYSVKTAVDISNFVKSNSSNASKSRIRNILDAFVGAECIEEAKLFYNYLNAKSKDKLKLPCISGYKYDSGFYVSDKGEYRYFWDDILDLEKLCGQDAVSEGSK